MGMDRNVTVGALWALFYGPIPHLVIPKEKSQGVRELERSRIGPVKLCRFGVDTSLACIGTSSGCLLVVENTCGFARAIVMRARLRVV
jgi:hypothetical protein